MPIKSTTPRYATHYRIDVDGQGLMSTRAPASEKALAEVGFAVHSETVRSRERTGERHTIFLGRRD